VGAGLDLDLGHDRVPDHPGDKADEPVTGRLADHGLRLGSLRRRGKLYGKPGQDRTFDAEAAGVVGSGGDATAVGSATHGVVADAEQVGRFTDTEDGHSRTLASTATPEYPLIGIHGESR